MEEKFHIKPGYSIADIAGQKVLMAPAIGDIDYSKMLVLSESAAFVAQRLMEETLSFDELVNSLLQEYEADEAVVRQELAGLLKQLRQLNVLV